MAFNSESSTFDLANRFTHNPRLMSPSYFRSPPKVTKFTEDINLISFDDELCLGTFGAQYPSCVASTPEGHSQTPELYTSTPRGHTSSPEGRSITPEGRTSTQDHTSSSEGHFSTPEDRSLTPLQAQKNKSLLGSSDGISLFSDTKFSTTNEEDEQKEEDGASSYFSDSSSSKLNWSLSASYSSCRSSVWSSERGRCSLTSENSDDSSSVVFARRRRRRKLSESPSSTPSDSTEYAKASRWDSRGEHEKRSPCMSQCSEEVFGILAKASITPPCHRTNDKSSSDVKDTRGSAQDGAFSEDEIDNTDAIFQPIIPLVGSQHVRPLVPFFSESFRHKGICQKNNSHEENTTIYKVNRDDNFPRTGFRCKNWSNLKNGANRNYERGVARTGYKSTAACTLSAKGKRKPQEMTKQDNSGFDLYKTQRPALPQTKQDLLGDPAILSVGEVVEDVMCSRGNEPNPYPQRNDLANNSTEACHYQQINLSSLFHGGGKLLVQTEKQQTSRTVNGKRPQSDIILQDPAVLYACRQNNANTALRDPTQELSGWTPSAPLPWQGCRTSSVANDPAIIAIGAPLCPIHAGVPSFVSTGKY